MEYKFHLIFVKHIAIDEDPKAPNVRSESDVPKKYLTVQSMVEFDTFTATHGPGTYVDGRFDLAQLLFAFKSTHIFTMDLKSNPGSSNKRKQNFMEGPAAKQPKTIYPAYFIPELAHVVAMCDEKLPFFALAQALNQRKLPHTGLQVEANSTSLVLKLLTLPMPETKSNDNKVRSIRNVSFEIRTLIIVNSSQISM